MSDKFKAISLMIGKRFECQCCARIAVIVDEYDEGPRDNGYVYRFEGVEGERWISTAGAAQRFRRIGDAPEAVRQALQKSVGEG